MIQLLLGFHSVDLSSGWGISEIMRSCSWHTQHICSRSHSTHWVWVIWVKTFLKTKKKICSWYRGHTVIRNTPGVTILYFQNYIFIFLIWIIMSSDLETTYLPSGDARSDVCQTLQALSPFYIDHNFITHSSKNNRLRMLLPSCVCRLDVMSPGLRHLFVHICWELHEPIKYEAVWRVKQN